MLRAINKLPENARIKYDFPNRTYYPPSAQAMAKLSYLAYAVSFNITPIISNEGLEINTFHPKERTIVGNVSVVLATDDLSTPPKAIISIAKSGPVPEIPALVIDWQNSFAELDQLFYGIISRNPQYDYFVCGHYIGGIFAQFLSREYRIGGASFCAPGLDEVLAEFGQNNRENYYDNSHSRFYNHIVLEMDDNNLEKQTIVNPFYYGDIRAHFPYHMEYMWKMGGEINDYGERATKEYFFNLIHLIDFHFSDQTTRKIGTYNNHEEFNDVSCMNGCCSYYGKRNQYMNHQRHILKVIIGTITAGFIGFLGWIGFDNYNYRVNEERRAAERVAQERQEEERRLRERRAQELRIRERRNGE